MKKITSCEVCGNNNLSEVLDLGEHPMCDDLIPVGSLQETPCYPIAIGFCSECKTAHQLYQIPKKTLFPISYHYRARHTQDVLNGMRELVERCEMMKGQLRALKVLDIGCNDGSLLSIFAEKGVQTLGVEPTGAAVDAQNAGHKVYQDYLNNDLAAKIVEAHGHPDIITFTNVFAHIEDLPNVLKSVRTLAGPSTMLVIENHYLGSVLDRYQFDTFYHEHPRTYSLNSFRCIAESLGAKLVDSEFPKRYGGNIRVFMSFDIEMSESNETSVSTPLLSEMNFKFRLQEMADLIPLWRKAKLSQIESAVSKYGPLPAKAFPGRSAILIKLLGLDSSMVSAVYEKAGSMKIGCYVPGTRIPIISDELFSNRPVKDAPLLNLAWHISPEIREYMHKQGFSGEIIDVLSPEEMRNIFPDLLLTKG